MRSVFHFRGLVTGRHANTKKQKPSSHNGATKTQTVPKVREMRTCSGGGAGAGVAGVLREKKTKKQKTGRLANITNSYVPKGLKTVMLEPIYSTGPDD